MNIRNLILLSISPVLLTSCNRPISSVAGCDSPSADFNIDQDLIADNVNYILENWNTEVGEISCDTLCSVIITQEDGWESNVESCGFELDTGYFENQSTDTAEDSVDETVVGEIQCTGLKFQYYCEGRRPLGHCEQGGGYFARAAHLEASSVIAFVQLVRQLRGWEAPQDLADRCLEAAKDELRHAAVISRLAKERGQEVPPISQLSVVEDLFTVARHNATEGCVFETWAALEAQLKSIHAETEELRQIYAVIATDEIRHAQLAWDLHRWFLQRLPEEQAERVKEEQRQAIALLRKHALSGMKEMPGELGLDTLVDSQLMLERFLDGIAA
jgi:hypothetical protein